MVEKHTAIRVNLILLTSSLDIYIYIYLFHSRFGSCRCVVAQYIIKANQLSVKKSRIKLGLNEINLGDL